MQYQQCPEWGVRSLECGIDVGCEPPEMHECSGLYLGPLEEQYLVQTAEPRLQPY